MSLIVEAVRETRNGKGVATTVAIRSFVKARRPDWPKVTFKTAMKRAVDKGALVIHSGKGLVGTYKLGKAVSVATKAKTNGANKKDAAAASSKAPLSDLLPNIFTWVCEPKEASSNLIKKYIEKHHPEVLQAGPNAFKKGLERGENRGQLERLTGKGLSGTFQLVDKANKYGTDMEDAIEDAIIAMNEPKDASFSALKHYLSEYHLEYNVQKRPHVLWTALQNAMDKGWIVRVTGKGKSGSFRLAYPYYPNPRELWGEWYEESGKEKAQKKAANSKKRKSYEEEESEEDDDDEEEEEYIPKSKKRGAPKQRSSAPARKTKAKKKSRR